jgi:hypothetical protein
MVTIPVLPNVTSVQEYFDSSSYSAFLEMFIDNIKNFFPSCESNCMDYITTVPDYKVNDLSHEELELHILLQSCMPQKDGHDFYGRPCRLTRMLCATCIRTIETLMVRKYICYVCSNGEKTLLKLLVLTQV